MKFDGQPDRVGATRTTTFACPGTNVWDGHSDGCSGPRQDVSRWRGTERHCACWLGRTVWLGVTEVRTGNGYTITRRRRGWLERLVMFLCIYRGPVPNNTATRIKDEIGPQKSKCTKQHVSRIAHASPPEQRLNLTASASRWSLTGPCLGHQDLGRLPSSDQHRDEDIRRWHRNDAVLTELPSESPDVATSGRIRIRIRGRNWVGLIRLHLKCPNSTTRTEGVDIKSQQMTAINSRLKTHQIEPYRTSLRRSLAANR